MRRQSQPSTPVANLFLYAPLSRSQQVIAETELCIFAAHESMLFILELCNPFATALELKAITLETSGCGFRTETASATLPPNTASKRLHLHGIPSEAGKLVIESCVVRVMNTELRYYIDGAGCVGGRDATRLTFEVAEPQPVLKITSCSIRDDAIELLAGEQVAFSLTVANVERVAATQMWMAQQDAAIELLTDLKQILPIESSVAVTIDLCLTGVASLATSLGVHLEYGSQVGELLFVRKVQRQINVSVTPALCIVSSWFVPFKNLELDTDGESNNDDENANTAANEIKSISTHPYLGTMLNAAASDFELDKIHDTRATCTSQEWCLLTADIKNDTAQTILLRFPHSNDNDIHIRHHKTRRIVVPVRRLKREQLCSGKWPSNTHAQQHLIKTHLVNNFAIAWCFPPNRHGLLDTQQLHVQEADILVLLEDAFDVQLTFEGLCGQLAQPEHPFCVFFNIKSKQSKRIALRVVLALLRSDDALDLHYHDHVGVDGALQAMYEIQGELAHRLQLWPMAPCRLKLLYHIEDLDTGDIQQGTSIEITASDGCTDQ